MRLSLVSNRFAYDITGHPYYKKEGVWLRAADWHGTTSMTPEQFYEVLHRSRPNTAYDSKRRQTNSQRNREWRDTMMESWQSQQ